MARTRPLRILSLLCAVVACTTQCRDATPVLVLAPSQPSGSGTLEVVAPGYGVHQFTLQRIDLTAFTGGGTLVIDVSVAPDSTTDASFDVYPQGAVIPSKDAPTTSVARAYDVQKGQSSRLTYQFTRGEVVTLAAEGNWFSPAGNKGMVRYTASAR